MVYYVQGYTGRVPQFYTERELIDQRVCEGDHPSFDEVMEYVEDYYANLDGIGSYMEVANPNSNFGGMYASVSGL